MEEVEVTHNIGLTPPKFMTFRRPCLHGALLLCHYLLLSVIHYAVVDGLLQSYRPALEYWLGAPERMFSR